MEYHEKPKSRAMELPAIQRFVQDLLGAPAAGGAIGGRGLHSLRHSWVHAARSIKMDESIRKRLGGWSQGDAAGGYGWDKDLPLLKREIDTIRFPDVQFPPNLRRIVRKL